MAVEPGYEQRLGEDADHGAVGGTLSAWWGLSETLWLSTSIGGFQGLESRASTGPRGRVEAFGGIVAALDIFRVVPHIECGFGVVADRDSVAATVRLGVGADYLLTPEWALGAVLRFQPLPNEDFGSSALTPQLRLSYRFEG